MEFPTEIWDIIKSYMLPSKELYLDYIFTNRLREYLKTFKSLAKLQRFKNDDTITQLIRNTQLSINDRKNMVIDYICNCNKMDIRYKTLNDKVERYNFNTKSHIINKIQFNPFNPTPFDIKPFLFLYNINDILWVNNTKCIVVNKSYDYVEIAEFKCRKVINYAYYPRCQNTIETLCVRIIWTYPSTRKYKLYNYFNVIKLYPTNPLYYSVNINGNNTHFTIISDFEKDQKYNQIYRVYK